MIIDAHCDALAKLYAHPETDFRDNRVLDVNLQRLLAAGYAMQCFAIYIPEKVRKPGIEHVLDYIKLFHRKILVHPQMKFVRSAGDLQQSIEQQRIGALLTLEGCDALQGEPD